MISLFLASLGRLLLIVGGPVAAVTFLALSFEPGSRRTLLRRGGISVAIAMAASLVSAAGLAWYVIHYVPAPD